MQHSIVIEMKQFCHETVAKVNSLTSAHLELAKHSESEQLRGSPLELLALAVSVLVTYRAVSHAR